MKWNDILSQEAIDKGLELAAAAQKARDAGRIICPAQDQIFRALELTPPENVKAVIIGQDPYHTPGQANGLAFSIANGNPIQPSLRNIFKELCADIGCDMPTTTDLTPWAERGVLLLNATLTVEAHHANSHSNWGWHVLTRNIVLKTSFLKQPIVFLAWGNYAQDILRTTFLPEFNTQYWIKMLEDNKKSCILCSHPSPLSASRGSLPFFGSHCFSRTNELLEKMGSEKIDWTLN